MSNIVSLKDFIEQNSTILGQTIEKKLTPVWKPGEQIFNNEISKLLRSLFPVQKEIVKGVAKALYKENRKRLFICGEMGVGKTTIALSAVACSPKPLRTLVVCPGHLVEKWIRESKAIIPNVITVDLAVKNAISILEHLKNAQKPKNHEVWIISKERAKLSSSWKAAYIRKERKIKGNVYSFFYCPQCGKQIKEGIDINSIEQLHKKQSKCPHCNEPLWQMTPNPRRYAISEYIKRHLKNKFDLIILDEIHDYKGKDTLQGHTMGMLVDCSKYFLGLTGTFSGGYATDLFYLLFRIAPEELKKEGFTYHDTENFLKKYGVIEKIIRLDEEKSYDYGRAKKRSIIIKKRPGISPEVVGKYLLHRSCFVRLSDVIDGLPPYNEHVVTIEMDKEQAKNYFDLQRKLQSAILQYKMRAVSAMLQSLLCYPDSCAERPEIVEIKEKNNKTPLKIIITAAQLNCKLLPKEKELIELVKTEKAQNRKVLVYVCFTGIRDIRQRTKRILEEAGFSVGILPETVEPKKREEWINKHKNFDVLISNPELVKLGLDLYEYPTIIFFETGYNIFTLRQAARRSWRIGQKQPVNVYFFCYKNTMQETALSLIARKIEQALLFEGDLPEGLAVEFTETGSVLEELTKALVEGKQYSGAEEAWARMRKKEIEVQLGMTDKESIFSVTDKGKVDKLTKTKISATENVVVSITIQKGKKKSISKLTVQYKDLDELTKKYGILQMCLV